MKEEILDKMLEKCGWGMGDPGDDCMQCSPFDPYKFAELIVQECVAVVGHFEYIPDGPQGEYAMDVLRQHFGVE